MLVATVLAGFLFEMKISTGEDDSSYILAAQKFIDGDAFPTWHGSFYPIFLSFFLKLFGLKLFIFKLVSFVMIIGHIFVTYYAFRMRVPWILLLGTIIYTSVCLEILYFGGQTYSEALYLLIQISSLAAFYKLLDTNKELPNKFSKQWKEWLVFGFLMFLLSITRNVGWSMIIAVIIYFAIEKNFRHIIASIFSVAVFYIPYNIYKKLYWKVGGAGFEGQFDRIFWINPYDVNQGTENFSGLFNRFLENSELYLSKHFLMVLGWKEFSTTSIFLTIIMFSAFIFTFVLIYKKRRELLLPVIYIAVALGITFVSQQTMWDQIRLVLIYVPLSVLLFSTALWDFLSQYKNKNLKIASIVLLLLIIIPSGAKSFKIAKLHYPMLKANIEGDMLYGYTPDWRHYFEIVEWATDNIPKNNVIACRKPGMAFIYGNGRKFYGIYNIQSYKIPDVIKKLENDSILHHNYAFDFVAEEEKFYSLYPFFKNISAIINQENGKQYIVFSFDDTTNLKFEPVLYSSGTNYYTFEDLEKQIMTTRENDYAVYPDSLLNFLEKNNINFLIVASIRRIPEQKTENFITTIHRYIYFIELKYPGIFNLVWQAGKNEDEPAMLLKIDYNKK
ncbi:MAG: hypothetical protein JXL97_16800 [Bacteroidales bacterium]|nr:hypothetical protein [Bacteroidales bacterium]